MENDVKTRIIEIIEIARKVQVQNLDPVNPEALGYAYVAGYLCAAIEEIQRIAEAS